MVATLSLHWQAARGKKLAYAPDELPKCEIDVFNDWLIAIPARLGSERLPRKPLQDLGGLPLIVRVAQNLAELVAQGAALVVATDAAEVLDVCSKHGIEARLTSPQHASGTDRCAEVGRAVGRSYILNVQGDEPFVSTTALAALMQAFADRPTADMATLVTQTTDLQLAADPNAVKAVRGRDGYALYFSRAAVPYDRTAQSLQAKGQTATAPTQRFWHHVGVYAYRSSRLQDFVRLGPSPLEETEKLEQLRALEAGWRIWLEPTAQSPRGIDTPSDLEAARARFGT